MLMSLEMNIHLSEVNNSDLEHIVNVVSSL